MSNLLDYSEIPLGFGMALAQNTDALEHFAALPETRRQELIEGAHDVHSKKEMRQYVHQICEMM